ncbi:MAG: hypothetical protein HY684_05910 [Chloroflexi bacterium]|nr:hypothetical protein [Chloroflexota bacterium]
MRQQPFDLPDWLKQTRPLDRASRPPMLTALAVLWVVSGGIFLTAGFVGLLGATSRRPFDPLGVGLAIGVGTLLLALGLGAWNGWPWSRWLAVAAHALSAPFVLLQQMNLLTFVSVVWIALVVWYLTRPAVRAYYRR